MVGLTRRLALGLKRLFSSVEVPSFSHGFRARDLWPVPCCQSHRKLSTSHSSPEHRIDAKSIAWELVWQVEVRLLECVF